MLYEQGRMHHVGSLPELEDQLTTWIPEESPDSPDRVDALVHAATYHLKRDRAQSTLLSPYKAVRHGNGIHPAIAARRAAAARQAS